ncbi:MAG: hypothetical protein EAZ07_00260 [Cytophagales bacterium]|nr:MAG: hypothetical protein EAZ07_00260 [Cytophagales bacterium]
MYKFFFLILATLFLLIIGTSCKKDYTCTCTYGTVTNKHAIYDTKSNAEEKCDNLEGGGGGVGCKLD